MVLRVIYYILSSLMFMYGAYFIITGLFAFKRKKRQKEVKLPETYFAVIVAARNEEKVIGNLIESLNKQNYPKDKYEIIVAVNNTTDKTEEAAKKAGAEVLNVDVPVKTKGEVLKWVFAKLKNNTKIGYYVIFDADNIVDEDFLLHMNKSVLKGYEAAEGFRDTKNLGDNWISSSYALFYYMQNLFFNKARNRMGLSASINGTGFMLKKDLVDEEFDPKTITEDIETTACLALKKIKIDFVEKAVTYDEQPVKFMDSWHQRLRWSVGNLQCLKLYGKDLLIHTFKDKNLSCMDMLLMFATPIIQVLLLITLIYNACNFDINDILTYFTSMNIVVCLGTYLGGVLLNVFLIKYNKKSIKDTVSGILLYTLFILSWLPINIVSIFKRNMTWKQIKHDRNIAISSIKK